MAIESKAERKIAHDLLPHVFEGFDDERAAYRPVQQLRVWYPADDLAPPAAQPELQQQRLDGVVRAMAALRSLLRAHALDARREGLLPPALPVGVPLPSKRLATLRVVTCELENARRRPRWERATRQRVARPSSRLMKRTPSSAAVRAAASRWRSLMASNCAHTQKE